MSNQDSRARFFRAETYSRKAGEGRPVLLYRPRFVEPGEARALHTVGPGDRLDLIAARYFSDPDAFFRVADDNDCLEAEEILVAGRSIKIGEGD